MTRIARTMMRMMRMAMSLLTERALICPLSASHGIVSLHLKSLRQSSLLSIRSSVLVFIHVSYRIVQAHVSGCFGTIARPRSRTI
jgi:hypothetical protein